MLRDKTLTPFHVHLLCQYPAAVCSLLWSEKPSAAVAGGSSGADIGALSEKLVGAEPAEVQLEVDLPEEVGEEEEEKSYGEPIEEGVWVFQVLPRAPGQL